MQANCALLIFLQLGVLKLSLCIDFCNFEARVHEIAEIYLCALKWILHEMIHFVSIRKLKNAQNEAGIVPFSIIV